MKTTTMLILLAAAFAGFAQAADPGPSRPSDVQASTEVAELARGYAAAFAGIAHSPVYLIHSRDENVHRPGRHQVGQGGGGSPRGPGRTGDDLCDESAGCGHDHRRGSEEGAGALNRACPGGGRFRPGMPGPGGDDPRRPPGTARRQPGPAAKIGKKSIDSRRESANLFGLTLIPWSSAQPSSL